MLRLEASGGRVGVAQDRDRPDDTMTPPRVDRVFPGVNPFAAAEVTAPLAVRRLSALWIFALLVIWTASAFLYFWLMDFRLQTKEPTGFYSLQTKGFLAGQLALPVAPSPMLALATNPYLGSENRKYRILDLSYYKGKYYSYFGVVPIVLLTLPWKLVTGKFLTEPGATALLAVLLNTLTLAILLRARRLYYPRVRPYIWIAAYAACTLGNYTSIHLVGINAGTVAQMGAYCCLMALILALTGAGSSLGATTRALAWASFAAGLAVGCRPSFLPILGALLPTVWRGLQNHPRARLKLAVAVVLPFASILAALLIYNRARFDSFLEFGNRLQLTDFDYRRTSFLSLHRLAENVRPFLFHPPALVHFFPFFANLSDRIPLGLFWACPMALLLGVFRWHRAPATLARAAANDIEAGLLIATAGVFVLLAGFEVFLFHYEVDFFVPAVLAAVLAWCSQLEHRAGKISRRAWEIAGAGLCAATITLALAQTLAVADAGVRLPRLMRAVNGVVARWDAMHGRSFGPMELQVVFPKVTSPQQWPLLLTGSTLGDLCYMKLEPDGQARIGFFHTGAGGPLSEPFSVKPGRRYIISIQMGSLLPDPNHPFFDGRSADEIRHARSIYRATLDGRVVLEGEMVFYGSSPDAIWVGENPSLRDIAAPRFGGEIRSARRTVYTGHAFEVWNIRRQGAAALRFRMPFLLHDGVNEPLLATGRPGSGDVVFLEYLPNSKARVGVDRWGTDPLYSNIFPIDYAAEHRMTIESNGLASREAPVENFRVVLDGNILLSRSYRAHESGPEQVYWGVNAVGSSISAAMFTGTILGVEPAEPVRGRTKSPGAITGVGTIGFDLEIDVSAIGKSQPLLVSGRSGAADLLSVQMIDLGHAQFALDHWGVGEQRSAILALDLTHPHHYIVEYGPLYGSRQPGDPRAKSFRVTVDGVTRFEGTEPFYPTTPDEIQIGTNPVGASTAAAQLSGAVTNFSITP